MIRKKKTVKRKNKTKRNLAPEKKVVKQLQKRKKTAAKKPTAARKDKIKIVGVVTHYFPKVQAAAIKLKMPLRIGESVKIKGHTTDFTQTASSLQIDRVTVEAAKKGEEIGLLVNSRTRRGDVVYKE